MIDLSLPAGLREVHNRYVVPSYVERTSYGVKESNPYNKMFEERIIFLGVQIDDTSANDVIAQLMVLESLEPEREIKIYINSPGGMVTAGLAVYDTMQYIRCPITTICMGMAMSFGAVLLCAGTKGKRFALPHARIMIHQPLISGGGISGQATEIEIEAKEIVDTKRRLNEIIAKHTGQTVDKVAHDSERNFYLSAEEGKAYGIIDEVIVRKK